MSLDWLPLEAKEGGLNAIVETPRGSRTKLSYYPEFGVFRAKKLLPLGFAFPFAFGFLPSTRGEDGDPLDVLLITDADLPMGALVRVRLIGVIEAEQGTEGAMVRNDRLLAVPLLSHQDRPPYELTDIPDSELEEIEAFFTAYQKADGKLFQVLRRSGKAIAEQLVQAGRA